MKKEDKPRFGVVLHWLARKYPVGRDKEGQPIPTPINPTDLAEYFEALADLPIEALERGAKYHFGHSEFFPARPASLRNSVALAPRPAKAQLSAPASVLQLEMSKEEQKRRLGELFEVLNAKYGTRLRA